MPTAIGQTNIRSQLFALDPKCSNINGRSQLFFRDPSRPPVLTMSIIQTLSTDTCRTKSLQRKSGRMQVLTGRLGKQALLVLS